MDADKPTFQPYSDLVGMFAGSRVWCMDLSHLRTYARLARGLTLGAAGLRIVAEERRAMAARPASGRRGEGVVAVLPLLGAMSQRGGLSTASTDGYGSAVMSAVNDPDVRALVLEMDSPGGEVFGVDETASLIREARAKKPIVGFANSMAASASYWLLAQTSEIVVTSGGNVGSIGCYTVHEDWSRALDQDGVTVEVISAGEGKAEGGQHEPLSDEARAELQGFVDRYYGMFASAVSRGRGVPVEKVRSEWKAKLYGAKEAVSLGLADSVGTLGDAIKRANALVQDRAAVAASVDLDVETRIRARGR